MFNISGLTSIQRVFTLAGAAILCVSAAFFPPQTVRAQDAPSLEAPQRADSDQEAAEQPSVKAPQPAQGKYLPAIRLLPDSVAGLVRVPDVPAFRKAYKTTNIGRMLEDPVMQPFLESQRQRAKDFLQNRDNRIGIRLEDIYEISSGETVFAWLPFENDRRRPFSLSAIVDVRKKQKEAEKAYSQIDKDLVAAGWKRTDVTHQSQAVRVYDKEMKPGQLKVEQIAMTLNETRFIASDRQSVVTDLLDAASGQPKGEPIANSSDFKTVLERSISQIRDPATKDRSTIAVEWYAKPFQMGRIIRESLNVDRGNQVDVLKLLEGQGFDAIRAAGGVVVIAGNKFDVLHKGFIFAPPTTKLPSKYEKAARMLQFPNLPIQGVPSWVDENAASLSRLNVKIEEAFWAAESLVNEALNGNLFREIIDGIRDDAAGPQIDIPRDVLPNLDDQVLLVTDNTLPADIASERLLVAIRLRNATPIRQSLKKAMEAEPDASPLEGPGGVEIWKIQRNEDSIDEEFGSDLFEDFESEEEDLSEDPAPLLDQGALAVVDQGPGSDSAYLLFSTHPELLVSTIERILAPNLNGLKDVESIKTLQSTMAELGAEEVSFDRIVRTQLSFRVKYELLRQGKLRENKSVISSLIRRMVEDDDGKERKSMDVGKLPPLNQVEKYFPSGGSFLKTQEDGWELTGFFLK